MKKSRIFVIGAAITLSAFIPAAAEARATWT
jgi:hypothetical protein